jgi:hypothetical protein
MGEASSWWNVVHRCIVSALREAHENNAYSITRFQHFERLADIQMLAMLASVFSEPAAKEGVSNAMMRLAQHVRNRLALISVGAANTSRRYPCQ